MRSGQPGTNGSRADAERLRRLWRSALGGHRHAAAYLAWASVALALAAIATGCGKVGVAGNRAERAVFGDWHSEATSAYDWSFKENGELVTPYGSGSFSFAEDKLSLLLPGIGGVDGQTVTTRYSVDGGKRVLSLPDLGLRLAAGPGAEAEGDEVVAIVGADIITSDQLEERVATLVSRHPDMFVGTEAPARVRDARKRLLTAMVDALVVRHATSAVGIFVTEGEVLTRVREIEESTRDPASFAELQGSVGLRAGDVAEYVRDDMLAARLRNALMESAVEPYEDEQAAYDTLLARLRLELDVETTE